MDAEELKKRFEEARSFWHKSGYLEFKCRLPSRLELYVAGDKSADEHILESNHRLLCEHVLDWRGMTARHFIGEGEGEQPILFDKQLFRIWAADHLREVSVMITEIMNRTRERIEREEESLKNS